MTCPNCGSSSLSTYAEAETKTQGFDVCSACCGYAIFGWIGVLCGLCDTGSTTTRTVTTHVCNDCGTRF